MEGNNTAATPEEVKDDAVKLVTDTYEVFNVVREKSKLVLQSLEKELVSTKEEIKALYDDFDVQHHGQKAFVKDTQKVGDSVNITTKS